MKKTKRTEEEKASDAEFYYILSSLKRIFSRGRRCNSFRASKAKTPRTCSSTKQWRASTLYTYQCASCLEWFTRREIQVDHIDPVIPIGVASRSMSWDTIISRLFCDEGNLQVLCKACHKRKSKEEAAHRAENRKQQKDTA